MKQGIVISDLHLYANRSWATESPEFIYSMAQDADFLILNGDIFDFRWTALPTIEQTINKAEEWLTSLIIRFPNLQIHYVLGNHDCHYAFVDRLSLLADEFPAFAWYEFYFCLGHNLFLHGDCTNFPMTFEKHRRIRNTWLNVKKRPSYQSSFYALFDRVGGTRLFHHLYFPDHIIAERILYYLESLPSGFPKNIQNIYTGHSHLPINRYKWGNYYFYNTGSTIKGMPLNILSFR